MPDNRVSVAATNFVNSNINYISSDDYSRIVTLSNDSSCITGTRTFTSNVRVLWETPDNPYYDYVSDVQSVIRDLKIKDGQLYNGENPIFYDELCKIVEKLYRIAQSHGNLETRSEPTLTGDEYNE